MLSDAKIRSLKPKEQVTLSPTRRRFMRIHRRCSSCIPLDLRVKPPTDSHKSRLIRLPNRASPGLMPPQAINPAITYQQLAQVLEQLGLANQLAT